MSRTDAKRRREHGRERPGHWAINFKAGHILKRDLRRAGVAYRDDAGRVADFHALRHTYITRLGRAGVSVQQAKELARHSDAHLTLGGYQLLEIRDQAAVDRMPTLPSIDLKRTAGEMKATGPEGANGQNRPSETSFRVN